MASINRFHEETLGEAVVLRDINNQITAFCRIFHSNYPKKNHSYTELVGVGTFNNPRLIMKLVSNFVHADTVRVKMIDDEGNVYMDYFCN